jgi:hypothetical protein
MIQTIFGSPVVFLKTDNIEELFPATLYEEIVDYLLRPDNIVDQIYAQGGKISLTDNESTTIPNLTSKLNLLLEFLKNAALKYTYLYSTKKDLKFAFYQINLSFQGCEIKNHDENDSHSPEKSLIVMFYPKVPIGGAELVFIHNGNEGDWVSDCLEKNLVRVTVDDGTIVIFDSFTPHAVSPHKVAASRMSITVAFTLET